MIVYNSVLMMMLLLLFITLTFCLLCHDMAADRHLKAV